jgi:hypothetical protein
MRVILIALSFAVHLASAVPPKPRAEAVTAWAAFSKPIKLVSENITSGTYAEWGKPIWVASYGTRSPGVSEYVIGVYKPGSYHKENRRGFEEFVSTRAKEVGETAQSKFFRVVLRPERRKVFLSPFAIGPSGVWLGAWTALPECDLVVMQFFPKHKNVPEGAAIPASDLLNVFEKVEQYIQTKK